MLLKIKDFVKTTVYRLFHVLDLHPPYRQRTPKEVYRYLKRKPASIKQHELKKITSFVRMVNDHRYYESLLKAFVPQWNETVKEADFIGEGHGINSLDTYRKVMLNNKLYFEKVYFNSRQTLQTIECLQHVIYGLVKNKINTAKIQKVYKGELLVIVYYEFLDLTPLPEGKKEERLVKMSKDLYTLSFNHHIDSSALNIPEHMKDFRNRSKYQRNVRLAKTKLLKQGVDFDNLEEAVAASKCVLTHGDIRGINCFMHSVLIDWDSFGIYPIGFEPARLYHYLFVLKRRAFTQHINEGHFMHWLEQHYKAAIAEEDWAVFEQNFLYFLFIFPCKPADREPYKEIEQQLAEALKAKMVSYHPYHSR